MLTPGQILRKRREETRKSLSRVSQETKIQERFLRYIENDDFSKFDSGVFVSGFIKIYADYLDLDVDKMLALYRRTSKEEPKKKKAKVVKKGFDLKKLITPVNIAVLVTLLSISSALIYFSQKFYEFSQDPEVEILSPSQDAIVETDTVSVLGVADSNSEVHLNGEKISVKSDGTFEANVKLEEGENNIKVIARNINNSEKTAEKEIKIEYVKPSEEQEIEEEEVKYTVRLEIIDEPSWIRLIIDNEQKYAWILQPGISESFEAKESIIVGTGKPSTTKLFINDQEYPLTSVGSTSISCTIQNYKLNCI